MKVADFLNLTDAAVDVVVTDKGSTGRSTSRAYRIGAG
jgi:hypothetical protein